MPKCSAGIHYEVHGRGFPIMLGMPVIASPTPYDPDSTILRGYLDRLTDKYRVLVMDYPDMGPDIGRSKRIPPEELTAQRVCDDLLSVADAAGLDRFAWWGFSWGGVIGLQLAIRSNRVAALVCGGWPPLSGPYAEMLQGVRIMAVSPPSDPGVSPRQYVTFYESLENWPEAEAVARINCPKMTYVGTADEVEIGGVKARLGALVHERRNDLEQQGWRVAEISGRDHSVCEDPETVVPIVRSFLDEVV